MRVLKVLRVINTKINTKRKLRISDCLVLHWLLQIDISLFIKDAIGAVGALDGIIRLEIGLSSAL